MTEETSELMTEAKRTEAENEAQRVTDATAESHVLRAESVSHAFGDVAVLDDISVDIEPGTLTALIGPNGSGKTTLLRVLCELITPTDGSVTYTGPESERHLGYVPQHPSFRPNFTVRETLEFYTTIVEDDPDEILERVGLADATDRRIDALSGGMIRLLGIGQATVGDPPIVVLDEPASGLDPGVRRRIFDFARELAADGTAVLYSSHDLDNVDRYADRVLVLDRGQLVAADSPESLREEHDADSLWDVFESITTDPKGAVEILGESA